jgi:hypothetical protein
MIWRRKDPAQNHFATFPPHHDQRLAALEADIKALTEDLLAYLEADIAAPWKASAERLAGTLRAIAERRKENKL